MGVANYGGIKAAEVFNFCHNPNLKKGNEQ